MNADPNSAIDRELAVRYLLGTLSDEQTDRLEERLLTEGQASDEVAATADDLLDDYVSGQLSRADRVAFERQLRTSGPLRERAAFARSLERLVREREIEHSGAPESGKTADDAAVVQWPARRPVTRWAQLAAAASLVLGIGCGWLLWRSESLRQEVLSLETAQRTANERVASVEDDRRSLVERAAELDRQLVAEREAAATVREENAQLAAALEESGRPAPRPPVTTSFVLSAALRSELGERRLELPAAAERVRLTLDLGVEEEFPSFLAVLTGPAGDELWSAAGLQAGARRSTVEAALPASLLGTGRHEVLLYGESPDAGTPPELVGAFEFDLLRR